MCVCRRIEDTEGIFCKLGCLQMKSFLIRTLRAKKRSLLLPRPLPPPATPPGVLLRLAAARPAAARRPGQVRPMQPATRCSSDTTKSCTPAARPSSNAATLPPGDKRVRLPLPPHRQARHQRSVEADAALRRGSTYSSSRRKHRRRTKSCQPFERRTAAHLSTATSNDTYCHTCYSSSQE